MKVRDTYFTPHDLSDLGLGQVIRPRDMIVTLVDTYSDKRQSQLAPVIAKLCGDGYLRPTGDDWDIIRLRVSDVDFRNLIVKVIELRGNGLKGSMKFLLAVFRPGENFEVSECVRLILDSSWVLDFLPSKKKKTREMLNDVVVKVIPFARKVVDDFVIDYLGLEPLPSDTPLVEDIASASSSSGSDMESKGSLEDFVVDEDEDDEGEIYSSDSSSASSSSDDDNNRRRPVKKLKTTTIEQDESSSSSSSSSSSESSDN